MKTLTLFLGITTLFFCSLSNASIISGSLTTDGGKSVNLSGLEWLSFDDTGLSTYDMTYADISAPSSIWSTAGWRYATNAEVDNLWQSLGLSSGQSSSNADGVDFLLDNWGGVNVPTNEFKAGYGANALTTTTLEHSLITAMFGNPCSGCEVDSLFLRDDFSITNVRDATGQVLSTSTFLHDASINQYIQQDELFYNNVASLLVRSADSATSVPEPSTLILMMAGLLGLGIRHHHKPPA